jgi:hypothetical protein
VLEQLQNDLSIPRRQIANLTFIVPLHIGRQAGIVRRVHEVALLQPNGNDLSMTTIAGWQRDADSFDVLSTPQQREALASWAGLSPDELEEEVRRRERALETLLSAGTESIPEVNQAIEAFYESRA